MVEYKTPSNSMKSKELPKANKVVSGQVTLKEKSITDKIKENSKQAIKTVVANTVVPSLKDMVLNAIFNGLSMIFFPDGNRRQFGNLATSKVTYNNYGKYYTTQSSQPRTVNIVDPVFKNPIVESMADAHSVINAMRDVINNYGVATWATLYDLCGMDSINWQGTTKYGWTSIESTTISTIHTADGCIAYELRMPKASPIDEYVW